MVTAADSQAVLIRSGGLGDFLLTLPLAAALAGKYRLCTVVTRRSYADLVRSDLPDIQFADIDGAAFAGLLAGSTDTQMALPDAEVYSLLPDADGVLKAALTAAGARRYVQLQSRPIGPPHFCEHLLRDAGVEIPEDLLDRAPLPCPHHHSPPTALWVHPGSGSRSKNAPLERLLELVRDRRPRRLILSFGEADQDLLKPTQTVFARFHPELVVCPSLVELRRRLAHDAAEYLGSDTGVTHLAAALGIPTTAIFITTDPRLWRPLGPRVSVMPL